MSNMPEHQGMEMVRTISNVIFYFCLTRVKLLSLKVGADTQKFNNVTF